MSMLDSKETHTFVNPFDGGDDEMAWALSMSMGGGGEDAPPATSASISDARCDMNRDRGMAGIDDAAGAETAVWAFDGMGAFDGVGAPCVNSATGLCSPRRKFPTRIGCKPSAPPKAPSRPVS